MLRQSLQDDPSFLWPLYTLSLLYRKLHLDNAEIQALELLASVFTSLTTGV